jgi:hypothetical protein
MNFLTRPYLFFYVMTAVFLFDIYSMGEVETRGKLDVDFSKVSGISNQIEMPDPYSVNIINMYQKEINDYFLLRFTIQFTFACFNLFILTLILFFYRKKIIIFVKSKFKTTNINY